MNKKILVTGAGGYIGSVLVPNLLHAGWQVVAFDRFFFGRSRLPVHPRLTLVQDDTRYLQSAILNGCHAVIDLAAVSNDPASERFVESTWAINHRARVRTANLAKQAGVAHYILPSSCSVYGHTDRMVDETGPTRPLSQYAQANLAAERDVLPLGERRFSVTVLRLATVFGLSPRMRFDLSVNAMTHDAWTQGTIHVSGDGRQRRPFVHVCDVAAAMQRVLAVRSALPHTSLLNIGSTPRNLTLAQVAEAISTRLRERHGTEVCIRNAGAIDPRNYIVDFSAAHNALSWQPNTDINQGIDEIIQAMKENGLHRSLNSITLNKYEDLEKRPGAYGDLLRHGGMLVLPCDSSNYDDRTHSGYHHACQPQ